MEDETRISFILDKSKKRALWIMAAENDVTASDLLRAAVDRVVSGEEVSFFVAAAKEYKQNTHQLTDMAGTS